MKRLVLRFLAPLLLALSLAGLSCSAAARLPNPFASPTPTATATFTPSPIPSPTPTFTPSPTPPPNGIETESLPGGETLVKDYDYQYELHLPPDWIVLPLTKEDLVRALDQAAREHPQMEKTASAFRQMDPTVLRLIAMNKNAKYTVNSYPTFLAISAVSNPIAASLPMAAVTAMIEDNIFSGSTDTTWEVKTSSHAVEVGIVQGSYQAATRTGRHVDVVEKVVAFQSNKKLIMVEILTPKETAEQILPSADQILDTIQRLGP